MATSYLVLAICLATVTGVIECSYLVSDSASCDFGKLPCDDGQCVPRTSWCDGFQNCDDRSDETYCRQVSWFPDTKDSFNVNNCVKSRHFQCNDSRCIPKVARCDDLPDCDSGDDEEGCDYSYESLDNNDDDITTTTATTPTITTSTTTTTSPKPLSHTRGDVSAIPTREDVLAKSVRFLIEERDPHWGWGKSTPRMTTALYLANESYFDVESHDGQLTKKQLEVQLALDLMRYQHKPLRMYELSHYIHALIATCQDPKNFHSVNIVKLLKKEMAERQARGLFLSPLAYLALCNAGDFSDGYIKRMKNMAYRRNEEHRWLDIQAYALLAISCRSRNHSSSKEWSLLKKDVARNLSDWQQPDGSFGSVYSTGLALQALIAADEPSMAQSTNRALAYLRARQDWQGSFGNELDNYYVLPALNLKSLASVQDRKCQFVPYDTQATEAERSDKKKKKMYVHYSLWIGGEKNEIHTITLGVPRHSNFIEIMEAAEKINPRYKHDIWTTARGPVVNSIAGRSSDAERSTYWTLYRRVPLPFRPQLANATVTIARLKLLGAKRWFRDLRKLHPKDGEHLAFWYKPYL